MVLLLSGGRQVHETSYSVFPGMNEILAPATCRVWCWDPGQTINTQGHGCGPGGGHGARGGDTNKASDHTGQHITIHHTQCHPPERMLNFAFMGIF